MKSFQHVMARG